MELELTGTIPANSARTLMAAAGTYTVEAAQSLKIETSPDGEEILNEEVPAGKVWTVRIDLSVIEADAS